MKKWILYFLACLSLFSTFAKEGPNILKKNGYFIANLNKDPYNEELIASYMA